MSGQPVAVRAELDSTVHAMQFLGPQILSTRQIDHGEVHADSFRLGGGAPCRAVRPGHPAAIRAQSYQLCRLYEDTRVGGSRAGAGEDRLPCLVPYLKIRLPRALATACGCEPGSVGAEGRAHVLSTVKEILARQVQQTDAGGNLNGQITGSRIPAPYRPEAGQGHEPGAVDGESHAPEQLFRHQ